MTRTLQQVVDDVCGRTPQVRWSVCLRTHPDDLPVAAHRADLQVPTASVGKLLLLVAVAQDVEAGVLDPHQLLARRDDLAVADSGLWQHLRTDALPVEDLAVLVASVSDNLATNVLLERVGLPRVAEVARDVGLRSTALLDRVRDVRTDEHPPQLSVGTAEELSLLIARLAAGGLVRPSVCDRLDRWLAVGADLSMVASAFGLDPLAHVAEDRGLLLRHKTGTDATVRADVGHVRGPSAALAYAVLADWDGDGADHRDDVLAAMAEIGRAVAAHVG